MFSHFNWYTGRTHLNEGLYFHPDEGRVVVCLRLLVDSGPQFVCEHLIRHLAPRVLPLHLPVLRRRFLRVFCTKATRVALVSRHQGSCSNTSVPLQKMIILQRRRLILTLLSGVVVIVVLHVGDEDAESLTLTPPHCASSIRPPSAQKTVNVPIKSVTNRN